MGVPAFWIELGQEGACPRQPALICDLWNRLHVEKPRQKNWLVEADAKPGMQVVAERTPHWSRTGKHCRPIDTARIAKMCRTPARHFLNVTPVVKNLPLEQVRLERRAVAMSMQLDRDTISRDSGNFIRCQQSEHAASSDCRVVQAQMGGYLCGQIVFGGAG